MHRNHLNLAPLVLAFCTFLSLGNGHPVDNNNGTLKLSIFGRNVRNGTWTTAFSFEKASRNISRNWNLRLYQNVSAEGPINRMQFIGMFTDNVTEAGADGLEPIFIQLLPETPKEESSVDDNCTESITGGAGVTWEIVSRAKWSAQEPRQRLYRRSKTVDFVVFRQENLRCFTKKDCIERMKGLQTYSSPIYGDVLNNFYVGDDGNVYEGRGWDTVPHRSLGGLENSSLSVSFFGKFQDDLPSPQAIEAFRYLLEFGICLGKLSPEYRLISYRLFHDYNSFVGDRLNDEARKWDHYAEHININSGLEPDTAGQFPVVFREEWNARKANMTFDSVSTPIEYVVVMNYFSRCFNRKACARSMQLAQGLSYKSFGDFGLNFCVGDDGMAYEGRGWDLVPAFDLERISKKYIIVGFFGHHQSLPPSPRAYLAFNKLVKLGVWLGKVSPDYKILFHRINKKGELVLGERLEKDVKKLERYSSAI